MSIQLFPVESAPLPTPHHVLTEAVMSERYVAKIVWDEDDIPEHAKGFVQWSVRPYRVSDGCDGSRDENAKLVLLRFCQQTGIDIRAAYRAAYPDGREQMFTDPCLAYLESLDDPAHTEIPALNSDNLQALLDSLYDMNYRSFAAELGRRFNEAGYATDYGEE